jgi:ribosome-associated heat shock protein Hsp15
LSQRLDKWLVYARFCKHRSVAQNLIESGQVRLNRDRVTKVSHAVKPHDVITIAVGGHIKVVKVLGEAERRGSAIVASQLYETLNAIEKADASETTLV